MYQVLARKWRPQTFDDLVGQRQVAKTLTNALRANRLAHAYVFAGMRGTGKTTVARILAKCLNCETGPTVSPCGTCAPCLEIAESRAMDVLEIDAASRTKVEQTRELLDLVSYSPVRDRYKVLIIDEAHMLSKASFNALLKTLEEPPPNVIFLMATTELQRVLPTILSRCQVFEFRRVTSSEVAGHLRRICDDEGVEISDAALERLARAGEGSVRDSLSLLERGLALCGEKISDDDVLRMLGAVRSEIMVEFVSGLARRDAGAMLSVLDGLVDEGHDLIHFWGETIGAVRDLLLLHALPGRHDLLVRSAEEGQALAQAAEGLSREDLTRAFHVLADLEIGLRSSAQPRFLFEATLIRLAGLGAVRAIEEILGELASATPPRVAREPESAVSLPEKKKYAESPGRVGVAPSAAAFVQAVGEARPFLGAILGQASSLGFDDSGLFVRLPAGMEAVKRQLELRESLALLEREVERLAGKPRPIRIELEPAPAGDREGQERGGDTDAPPVAASRPQGVTEKRPGASAPAESGGLIEEARRDPGVRSLLDTFGAHVVDIRRLELPNEHGNEGEGLAPAEDSP